MPDVVVVGHIGLTPAQRDSVAKNLFAQQSNMFIGSRQVSAQWRGMSEEQREEWRSRADELLGRYQSALPAERKEMNKASFQRTLEINDTAFRGDDDRTE